MNGTRRQGGAFAPLRHVTFRRIWSASLLSNFGLLINGVGAGWAMTTMSGRPQDVALVQAALMAPYMLFSMAAGAIADTYDRRLVSLCMLAFAFASSCALAIADWCGWLTPAVLVAMCFIIGTANAMFGPSWQASVSEQVPHDELASAVALNSVSYNIARSIGPAVGGAVVAAAGSLAAFVANGMCYLPMVAAMLLWRRAPDRPRLPPESIGWAILSGFRYVMHSPPTRTVLLRCVTVGIAGGAVTSLMPLVSRDLLGGKAATYGFLLGAFGVGAVFGAVVLGRLRRAIPAETMLVLSSLIAGGSVVALAISRSQPVSLLVLTIAGAAWLQIMTGFNVAIQTQAPRWAIGRALAGFQAAAAGGLAIGSILWGVVAGHYGTAIAVGASGVALAACAGLARIWPLMEGTAGGERDSVRLDDPEVVLAVTGRSGPIVVEIDHVVAPSDARRFYIAMLEVRRIRHRNGVYGWTLARDLSAADRWVERFYAPTWHDYLRQRDRLTPEDHAIIRSAGQTSTVSGDRRVRRLLERPFGSVRWQPETPDPGVTLPIVPGHGV